MTPAAERFLRLIHDKIAALKEATGLWHTHRRINDLEHLILCDLLTEEEERQVLNLEAVADVVRVSQDLFCRFETTIEKSMAQYLIGSESHLVYSQDNITQNYLQRYRTLASQEIRLAGIGVEDRVLFIGSGPLPITAIEYVKQTGCAVNCVDHLPEPIEISKKVVHRLGMSDRMRLLHARGQDCKVRDYDVILVAVLAEPKPQILSHLDHHADPDCRILCRTTLGVRQFIYPRTVPIELTRFGPAGFSRAMSDQIISLQLLTANAGVDGWEKEA